VRSKKLSAAKPPNGIVFFIDRSLGVEPIRTELVKAGLTVAIHDDHFARYEEDRVWLRKAGDRSWVILTKDQRLRYRPLEIAALRASNARVFVPMAGNLRGSEIAAVFLGGIATDFQNPVFSFRTVLSAYLATGTRRSHLNEHDGSKRCSNPVYATPVTFNFVNIDFGMWSRRFRLLPSLFFD
jgi:hypothetical protein